MENQNQDTTQTQQSVQVPTPETHNVAFPSPVGGATPAAVPVPAPPQPPVVEEKPAGPLHGLWERYKAAPKNIKLLITVGLVFFVLVFLLLVAALVKNMAGGGVKTDVPIATPTAAPSAPLTQVEISNPSRYATDSGILKIESDVDSLSKEMNSVDLRQSNLRVPSLDFNIKFQ